MKSSFKNACKNVLAMSGALLALTAFASTADARMGGMSMSPSMSRGDMHTTISPSLGSPRGSDISSFRNSGRSFDVGLQTRDRGSHWKHPIDSDQGGPDDPPKKTPKGGGTQAGGGWTPQNNPWDPYGFHNHHPGPNGYVDKDGHYHPPTHVGDSDEPAPASRTPR